MATCKWCRKGGIFIRVDRYGLCNNCSDAILIEVNSRVKVIQESKDIINSSKKLDTVLSRLDTIVMHAQELRKYEDAANMQSKETSLTQDIAPGTWNKVDLILAPVKASEFNYLSINIEEDEIQLLN